MRKFKYTPFLLSFVILVVSIIAVSESNTSSTSPNTATYDEVTDDMKGVWVSYITLDMQNTNKSEEAFVDKINTIIETTKNSGFNTLVVQVRPFCDALYKSRYFPWSHILTSNQGEDPKYDPLEIMCELCHENGISIHAWINPYRVSTNETPESLSEDNPYIFDNSIGFEHNGNIYLDPSSDKAQKLIVNGVTEIVKNYDVDGIQFDDYFYPEDSDDVDNESYEKYQASVDSPLTKEQWRAENVNNLIKKVYEAVHKNSEKVVFGVSPQGNINNNMSLGADVKTWCETQGYIDYICPQIYFSLDNPALTFEDCLSQWQKLDLHKDLKVYVGLAGYKGGSDDDDGTWLDNNDILQTEIEICREKGVDGIMLYSYDSFNNDENQAEIQNVISYLTGVKE